MSAWVALERAAGAGKTVGMALGKDLLRENLSPAERGDALLLNPRMPANIRERVLAADFPDLPQHVWIATSGTGGRLKVVALPWASLEASAHSVNCHLAATASDVWLSPLPPFHVGGLGMMVRAHLSGAVHVAFDQPWNAVHFAAAVEAAGATLSAVVPTQVHDLVQARRCAPHSLRAVVVGGGELAESLRAEAASLGWPLLPSYGLTEAASQVATAVAGQTSFDWLPLLGHIEARTTDGVLEIRGSSLLTGWMIFDGDAAQWSDPKCDGWYRTSDRAELRGRELRILGRVDDLVKIRGELVDLAALERDLQSRVTLGEVLLRGVWDQRNGTSLEVVAENAAAADQARAVQALVFPPYARPREFKLGKAERTALGKRVRV